MNICCSYEVNAVLLKYNTTLDTLYARYGSEEVAQADAAFYRERRREEAPEVVGLDVASKAVSYGISSGILDAGFAENLEEG